MAECISRRRLLAAGGVALAGTSGCLRFVGGSDQTETPADRELTAAFEFTPEEPAVGEEVSFDASPSVAPGSDIERYRWLLVPDPGGAPRPIGGGETTTHRFPSSGPVLVGLRIRDSAGNLSGTINSLVVTGDISDVGDWLTLEWGDAFVPARDGGEHPEDDRSLSFACRRLELRADGDSLASFDIGGESEPLLDRGIYGREQTDDGETFRWLGGPKRLTRLVFPDTAVTDATALVLEGNLPPTDEPQPVTVSVNGTVAADVTLTERTGTYRIALT